MAGLKYRPGNKKNFIWPRYSNEFAAFLLECNMNLDECRELIDSIDTQILVMLNKRAELSQKIGRLKEIACLPVTDSFREEAILRRIARDNSGELEDEAAVRIFRQILAESRRIQITAGARSAIEVTR